MLTISAKNLLDVKKTFYFHLKMTSERWNCQEFLLLIFITKSVSKKLLNKIMSVAENIHASPKF